MAPARAQRGISQHEQIRQSLHDPKVRNQQFLPKPGDKLVVLAEEDG